MHIQNIYTSHRSTNVKGNLRDFRPKGIKHKKLKVTRVSFSDYFEGR
jgi:hypothetical protein